MTVRRLFSFTRIFETANPPSETAFDPEHPYFDEKSDREKPKWCLVHVRFVQKFPEMIKLKELQKYSKDGGVLENMQVLKQSRLSVSKVSKNEWYVTPVDAAVKIARLVREQNRRLHPRLQPLTLISNSGLVWEENR